MLIIAKTDNVVLQYNNPINNAKTSDTKDDFLIKQKLNEEKKKGSTYRTVIRSYGELGEDLNF